MLFKPSPPNPELEALIGRARVYVEALTPAERREMIRQQIEGAAGAKSGWNEDATVVVGR